MISIIWEVNSLPIMLFKITTLLKMVRVKYYHNCHFQQLTLLEYSCTISKVKCQNTKTLIVTLKWIVVSEAKQAPQKPYFTNILHLLRVNQNPVFE